MMEMSGSRESSSLIIVSAEGIDMASKITTGITVQITSAVVLCENVAASAPVDLRCMISDQIIAPKTIMPITTQIQKTSMCRS